MSTSALVMLPDDTRAAILVEDRNLRPDLLVIPAAEAAGWTVSFRNDHWHNAAGFQKDTVHVWFTGRDCRRAVLSNGRYGPPEVFSNDLDGVRRALDLSDMIQATRSCRQS